MRSPSRAATRARRELKRLARPVGEFDASRYFRGSPDLGFYNVGTRTVRDMAKAICLAHRRVWSLDEALAFAEALIADRYVEVKGLGIEVLARHRRAFAPRLLPVWKRWLAEGHASNWATTDAMCGYLIGPLIVQHPDLAGRMRTWSRHRSQWVRRAAAVSLIPPMREGFALDIAYDVARALHGAEEDLIQKAVGWMLREAGRTNPVRLERYLRENGPTIPRTTVRYAIERMPEARRRAILEGTKDRSAAGHKERKRSSEATPEAIG